MRPKVSVVTPTFNRCGFLPEVWESLKVQTETNFQWIIVDDGSQDRTRETVEAFADPRITYVWQPNSGVNAARKRGDLEVTSDYVIYLDSDDQLFGVHTLGEMVEAIERERPDVICVSFTVKNSAYGVKSYYLSEDYVEANYADHICEQKFRGEFFPIYRAESITLSEWPSYQGCESLRHWRLVRHRRAVLINRIGRLYNVHHGASLSDAQSVIKRSESMAQALAELISEHKPGWKRYCPCQIGSYHLYRGMYLLLSGNGFRALPDLVHGAWYGGSIVKFKAAVGFLSVVIPLALRRWLFIQRAQLQ